jgi:hypothetical protein
MKLGFSSFSCMMHGHTYIKSVICVRLINCTCTCHISYPSPFPSVGNVNNIIWMTHIINRRTNQHLPLVFPICSLSGTTCKYHVHCATGSKLPLAISMQSVVPAVDDTEMFVDLLCLLSVRGLILLIRAAMKRRLTCMYCAYCSYCTHCTYCFH